MHGRVPACALGLHCFLFVCVDAALVAHVCRARYNNHRALPYRQAAAASGSPLEVLSLEDNQLGGEWLSGQFNQSSVSFGFSDTSEIVTLVSSKRISCIVVPGKPAGSWGAGVCSGRRADVGVCKGHDLIHPPTHPSTHHHHHPTTPPHPTPPSFVVAQALCPRPWPASACCGRSGPSPRSTAWRCLPRWTWGTTSSGAPRIDCPFDRSVDSCAAARVPVRRPHRCTAGRVRGRQGGLARSASSHRKAVLSPLCAFLLAWTRTDRPPLLRSSTGQWGAASDGPPPPYCLNCCACTAAHGPPTTAPLVLQRPIPRLDARGVDRQQPDGQSCRQPVRPREGGKRETGGGAERSCRAADGDDDNSGAGLRRAALALPRRRLASLSHIAGPPRPAGWSALPRSRCRHNFRIALCQGWSALQMVWWVGGWVGVAVECNGPSGGAEWRAWMCGVCASGKVAPSRRNLSPPPQACLLRRTYAQLAPAALPVCAADGSTRSVAEFVRVVQPLAEEQQQAAEERQRAAEEEQRAADEEQQRAAAEQQRAAEEEEQRAAEEEEEHEHPAADQGQPQEDPDNDEEEQAGAEEEQEKPHSGGDTEAAEEQQQQQQHAADGDSSQQGTGAAEEAAAAADAAAAAGAGSDASGGAGGDAGDSSAPGGHHWAGLLVAVACVVVVAGVAGPWLARRLQVSSWVLWKGSMPPDITRQPACRASNPPRACVPRAPATPASARPCRAPCPPHAAACRALPPAAASCTCRHTTATRTCRWHPPACGTRSSSWPCWTARRRCGPSCRASAAAAAAGGRARRAPRRAKALAGPSPSGRGCMRTRGSSSSSSKGRLQTWCDGPAVPPTTYGYGTVMLLHIRLRHAVPLLQRCRVCPLQRRAVPALFGP